MLEVGRIALWDTGAATTTISSVCAKQLDLKPINEEFLKLNPDAVKSYRVSLIINNEITLEEVLVVSRDEVFEGFDMLIGMDIISKGRFAIVMEPDHIGFSYSLKVKDFDVREMQMK